MHNHNVTTGFVTLQQTHNNQSPTMQPHFQQQHLQPSNMVILDASNNRLASCPAGMMAPHLLPLPAMQAMQQQQQQYGTPLATPTHAYSDGASPANLVFAWNSSPDAPQEISYSQYTRNVGGESHNAVNSPTTSKQLHGGAMTTPARGCYTNTFNVVENDGSRGAKASKTRVQTSIRTTTTSPQSSPPMLPLERNIPHNEQLKAQLEQMHQMFRDGLMDSKDYHQRVSDLMVQMHNGGITTTSNMYPSGDNTSIMGNPNIVVLPSSPTNQMVLPTRLVSTESGMGVMGNIQCPQTSVIMPQCLNPLGIDQSHYTTMLNPLSGQAGFPLSGISMNPTGGGQATTTTTTTTTTRKRNSGTRSMSARRRGQRNVVQSSRCTVHAVALSPSDLLLVFKLLEKEQGSVSTSQIVALFYTLVGDAARALQHQLKLNPKSNAMAPELKRILTSSSAASNTADELGSFANSLYKTLKRARIDGLKSKHNRLRLLATEASTRKWQGAELLTFVAQLLVALNKDLSPSERIAVLKALVDKLQRRAGSSGSLGELYRAFEVVFPGTNEESDDRLAARRRDRSGLRSLTFSNDLCHGCDKKLIGFRFRCLDCHNAAIAQGLDSPSASKRSYGSTKRSGKNRNNVEYLLCADCFLSSHSGQADENTGEDSFGSSSRAVNGLRHKNLSSCTKEFICEVPFSLVSISSLAHRPLGHICMAPVQGWRSPGAATAMVPNRHDRISSSSRKEKQSSFASAPARKGTDESYGFSENGYTPPPTRAGSECQRGPSATWTNSMKSMGTMGSSPKSYSQSPISPNFSQLETMNLRSGRSLSNRSLSGRSPSAQISSPGRQNRSPFPPESQLTDETWESGTESPANPMDAKSPVDRWSSSDSNSSKESLKLNKSPSSSMKSNK